MTVCIETLTGLNMWPLTNWRNLSFRFKVKELLKSLKLKVTKTPLDSAFKDSLSIHQNLRRKDRTFSSTRSVMPLGLKPRRRNQQGVLYPLKMFFL